MSRQELADAANAYLWNAHQRRENMTEHDIGRYERGEVRWPRRWRRLALRGVLGAGSDKELGFYPNRHGTTTETTPVSDRRERPAGSVPVLHERLAAVGSGYGGSSTDSENRLRTLGEGGRVSRRGMLLGAGVVAVDAMIPKPGQEVAELRADLADVAAALTGDGPTGSRHAAEAGQTEALAAAAAELKRCYQAGRYLEVVKALPRLLRALGYAEVQATGGYEQLALMADVNQTACSVLLKLGEGALAMLAADRSMTAARRSGDPVRTAASARALAHALANSGHHGLATVVALEAARQLEPGGGSATMEGLAVYGALLLRASVIAATGEDRATALDAVNEAHETARRIHGGDNTYWTYFCPVNVQLHRVSVAVNLGDAGQAIEHARQVNPGLIPLAERRACFYVDIARAYLQWRKCDQAYEALHAAEQTAPEEIAVRPQVHTLVSELQQQSPPRIQGRVMQLAHRIQAER